MLQKPVALKFPHAAENVEVMVVTRPDRKSEWVEDPASAVIEDITVDCVHLSVMHFCGHKLTGASGEDQSPDKNRPRPCGSKIPKPKVQ